MLLKAAILHRGGAIRKPGEKLTIGFDECLRTALSDGSVHFPKQEEVLQLPVINTRCDAAQHYLVDLSEQHLCIHAQAGLTSFRDVVRAVFDQDLAVHLPPRVLPPSTSSPTDFATLFDQEAKEVQRLLSPGKRRKVEAAAKLTCQNGVNLVNRNSWSRTVGSRFVLVVGVSLLFAIATTAFLTLTGCGSKEAGASYVPGLGEIMTLNQMRHAKLWFAGDAGNWPLASYELDELEEGFHDVVEFHPTHKESPVSLAAVVPEITGVPLAKLRAAIEAKNRADFAAGFEALTQACNSCHQATNFGFNVVTRPTANSFTNQEFAPPAPPPSPGH